MTKLSPKAGFDWARVLWGKPDSPRSAICSYCCAGIGEDAVPLIFCKGAGHVAQFCDACQETWRGIKSYDGPHDHNPEEP